MQGHKKCVRVIKVLDLILLCGRFISWYMQYIEKFVYQRLPSKGQCKSEVKVKVTKTAKEEVGEHFCHPSVHRLSAGTNNSPYLGAFSCAPLLPLFLQPLRADHWGRGNQSVPHHKEKSERVQSFT